MQAIITNLRQEDDEGAQLGALTELCEVLSISSEDTLTAFPYETVVPLLVRVHGQQSWRVGVRGEDRAGDRSNLGSLQHADGSVMRIASHAWSSVSGLASHASASHHHIAHAPLLLRCTWPLPLLVRTQVHCLNTEHNPDMMLLAARALTFMADVLPNSCGSIVRHGAVAAFCQRLLTIEYIDLAEQSLQVRLEGGGW